MNERVRVDTGDGAATITLSRLHLFDALNRLG
jgi:hypothetical protein